MKNTVVMIVTPNGKKYARMIGASLNTLGYSYLISSVSFFPKVFERHPQLKPTNCIIHPRAAHPNTSVKWMRKLEEYAKKYTVINAVKTLQLTADKLKSMLYFEGIIDTPYTWGTKRNVEKLFYNNLPKETVVIKPYISKDQGKNVTKFDIKHTTANFSAFAKVVENMPTSNVVVQEFIEYNSLYRIIVLNEKALPFAFVDKPSKEAWKVSVCLNKKMKYVSKVDKSLLKLAENVQAKIGGVVNFIDIFSTDEGYILSEINTACNLSIHEDLSKHKISTEIAKALVRHF